MRTISDFELNIITFPHFFGSYQPNIFSARIYSENSCKTISRAKSAVNMKMSYDKILCKTELFGVEQSNTLLEMEKKRIVAVVQRS